MSSRSHARTARSSCNPGASLTSRTVSATRSNDELARPRPSAVAGSNGADSARSVSRVVKSSSWHASVRNPARTAPDQRARAPRVRARRGAGRRATARATASSASPQRLRGRPVHRRARGLPAALRELVTVAYVTGWRVRSEVLPLPPLSGHGDGRPPHRIRVPPLRHRRRGRPARGRAPTRPDHGLTHGRLFTDCAQSAVGGGLPGPVPRVNVLKAQPGEGRGPVASPVFKTALSRLARDGRFDSFPSPPTSS